MIEIKCVADKAAGLGKVHGVEATTAFEMTERGERLGLALANVCSETADMVYLEAPDLPLTDALLRATLNALQANGVRRAVAVSQTLREFAVRKGYFPPEGPFEWDIREFFSKSACKG